MIADQAARLAMSSPPEKRPALAEIARAEIAPVRPPLTRRPIKASAPRIEKPVIEQLAASRKAALVVVYGPVALQRRPAYNTSSYVASAAARPATVMPGSFFYNRH